MKRDIKFKAKRLDNGEWESGSLVRVRMGCSDERVYIADKKTGYLTPVIPETICQYTGLEDKNGKEIWEGDRIVGDIANGYLPVKRLLSRIGIVEYIRSSTFVLKIINRFGVNDKGENDFCGEYVSFGAFGNREVIGTRFDDCLYKKPNGLCLRESDNDNNIYCVEGPCDEILGNIHDKEQEK